MSDHNNRKFQRELPGEGDKKTIFCAVLLGLAVAA
jgi:hypothetical protein